MGYILLDESGDLGFDLTKTRTSKFFVVTVLFTTSKRQIEKVTRKTHAELRKKHRMRGGVLHAYRESPITRTRLLKRLAEKECSVLAIILNKKKVFTKLQNEKIVLYNYVTNILLDRMYTKKLIPTSGKITLIASRKETNKFLNENFKNYLQEQIRNTHKFDLEVLIRTPGEEKALQAVDFASWAIFRKYEYSDDSYYRIVKNRVVEESPLFP